MMKNSAQYTVNNSTHNEINIVGNNNKLWGIDLSSRCSLAGKFKSKIDKANKTNKEAK